MNEHDLEQRLRAWYRAEIDDPRVRRSKLRADLEAFVRTAATPRRRPATRMEIPRHEPLCAACARRDSPCRRHPGRHRPASVRLPNVGPPPPSRIGTGDAIAGGHVAQCDSTLITGPIVGTWAGGEVRCAQQLAALEAAGFSAGQMTTVGVDLTCENGIAVQERVGGNGSQNTARFLPTGVLAVSSDNVNEPDSRLPRTASWALRRSRLLTRKASV